MLRISVFALCLTVVPVIAHAAVENLLLNNSFEDEELEWDLGRGGDGAVGVLTFSTEEVIDGERSLQVEVLATHDDSWQISALQTSLSLNKGKTYTLTFWAKAEKFRPLDIELKRTQIGGLSWQGITAANIVIADEWEEYVHNFVPAIDYPEQGVPRNDGENQAFAEVDFWFAGDDAMIWLDFVHLYEGDYEKISPSLAPFAVEPVGKLPVLWGALRR